MRAAVKLADTQIKTNDDNTNYVKGTHIVLYKDAPMSLNYITVKDKNNQDVDLKITKTHDFDIEKSSNVNTCVDKIDQFTCENNIILEENYKGYQWNYDVNVLIDSVSNYATLRIDGKGENSTIAECEKMVNLLEDNWNKNINLQQVV